MLRKGIRVLQPAPTIKSLRPRTGRQEADKLRVIYRQQWPFSYGDGDWRGGCAGLESSGATGTVPFSAPV